jgi:hypothetical protein
MKWQVVFVRLMVVQQQKGISSAVRYHKLQATAIDAVALFRDLVTVLPNFPVFINFLCFFFRAIPRDFLACVKATQACGAERLRCGQLPPKYRSMSRNPKRLHRQGPQ